VYFGGARILDVALLEMGPPLSLPFGLLSFLYFLFGVS